MPNRRHNKQVPGFKIGGRVAKMKGGSMNGKPISKSKNAGLAKMPFFNHQKEKKQSKKMGFNPKLQQRLWHK